MLLKNVLMCLILLCFLSSSMGFWNIATTSLNDFFLRFTRDVTKCPAALKHENNTDGEGPTQPCDENQLMLQLASLYIVSPERIILLLTRGELRDTCFDITAVLRHINTTFSFCLPLPTTNLYVKLYDGLEYFHSTICELNERADLKDLEEYQECFKELREELIDCEGPPDWFERKNQTLVCKQFDYNIAGIVLSVLNSYFNDIMNCNYVKAATLCGLKPALALRTFTAELLSKVILFTCPVPIELPHVDQPFPNYGSSNFHLQYNYFLKYYMFLISALFYFVSIYLR